MDTLPGLRELQERKRELLLESDLNRQSLRVECGKVRMRLEQFRRGYGIANVAWAWALPVAGLLFARKFKRTAGVVAKGSLLARTVRSLWKAWSFVRARRQAS